MTNLKGVRLYSNSGQAVSEAYKDVSSLAIIAPFSIYARVRLYKNLASTTNAAFGLSVKYGGAGDDKYQHVYFDVDTDGDERFTSVVNFATRYITPGGVATDSENFTYEDWQWIKLEVATDRTVTGRFKDDNTTTKPTSGWTTSTVGGVADATPSQNIQEVAVYSSLSSPFTNRNILEVDEIYVEQD